jgi:Mycoplasma protein of unknown function, DUF285
VGYWKVLDISNMFVDTKLFQGIGINHWNTSSVEELYNAFYKASLFDANLSQWDV